MSNRSLYYAALGSLILYPIIATIYSRLNTLGTFRSHATVHGTGEIKLIGDTINAEDLHYHAQSGKFFVACQGVDGSRERWFPPLARFDPSEVESADGGFRVIDPETFTARILSLEGFHGPFITHGIDIVSDPSNPQAIYIHAVNHLPNPDYYNNSNTTTTTTLPKATSHVEIFHHILHSSVAKHIRTVSHPLIKTPNDIFSTGPYSFYVTNDHYYREGGMRVLEDLGTKRLAGWTDIVHVDVVSTGKVQAQVALSGLHNNNGLGHNTRPDEILIADAAGGVAYLAKISPDHSLKVMAEVKLDSTIDNPSWFQDPYAESTGRDASGLILAGLVHGAKLAHEIDGGPVAPIVWHATRAAAGNTHNWEKRVIFQDDGNVLRSASVAVLLAIDPAKNDGRKQGWLWVTGFLSKAVIAVKVDL